MKIEHFLLSVVYTIAMDQSDSNFQIERFKMKIQIMNYENLLIPVNNSFCPNPWHNLYSIYACNVG